MRILFVCMGNICRSPTAEGVMRRLVRDAGLEDAIEIASAGTGAWHVGNPPDPRSTEAAARRGIALEGQAQQIRDADFCDYDLIVAMDADNVAELRRRAPSVAGAGRIQLLREFDPASDETDRDVPDPYYGGARGFDDVLDMVQAACAGLLAYVRPQL